MWSRWVCLSFFLHWLLTLGPKQSASLKQGRSLVNYVKRSFCLRNSQIFERKVSSKLCISGYLNIDKEQRIFRLPFSILCTLQSVHDYFQITSDASFFFRVVANLPLWSSFLPLFLFSARNYQQTCTNPPIRYHRQVKRNFIRSVHFMFCLNWLVNRKWRYRWSDRGPKVSRCDVTQPSDRRPIKDATLIPRSLSKSSQNASTVFVEL